MADIQEEITGAFIEKLERSPEFTPEMINRLRELFSDQKKKKLKPDDLEMILSASKGKVTN